MLVRPALAQAEGGDRAGRCREARRCQALGVSPSACRRRSRWRTSSTSPASHVLVTGASRGIGRAAAEALAAAGATVGVHYHRNEAAARELADALGHGAQAFGADLADAEAAAGLFAEAVDAFGRVDVLVNNAGVAEGVALDASDADWLAVWERTIAVNLTAVGVLCRAAAAHFVGARRRADHQRREPGGLPG